MQTPLHFLNSLKNTSLNTISFRKVFIQAQMARLSLRGNAGVV
jgi:hypothetical protein